MWTSGPRTYAIPFYFLPKRRSFKAAQLARQSCPTSFYLFVLIWMCIRSFLAPSWKILPFESKLLSFSFLTMINSALGTGKRILLDRKSRPNPLKYNTIYLTSNPIVLASQDMEKAIERERESERKKILAQAPRLSNRTTVTTRKTGHQCPGAMTFWKIVISSSRLLFFLWYSQVPPSSVIDRLSLLILKVIKTCQC